MRSAAAVLALVLLAARPAVLTAGPVAPSFEHVHALAFDAAGRALWLGAHSGLYHSEDGGKTWTKAALAGHAHGPDVMAIAPHPASADVLHVGTHEAGVLATSDGASDLPVRSALSPALLTALARSKPLNSCQETSVSLVGTDRHE